MPTQRAIDVERHDVSGVDRHRAVQLPSGVTTAERLARARELRSSLPEEKFRVRDIDTMKRERRP